MQLFDGIQAQSVATDRLNVNVLTRAFDDPATPGDRTVVLIHGNASSSLFWQELMVALPAELRVLAIDLRGAGDDSDTEGSPRAVFRSSYVAPGYTTEHEDVWVASMLSTVTGPDNYPGDSVPSENWPGFAARTKGVLNTLPPLYFNTTGLVDLEVKPPILWVRGSADAIVGDASFFDINMLGKVGAIPGWPGDEIAPPTPMIAQTRPVLDAYAAAGGKYRELVFEGVGHSPHRERPEEFRATLLELMEG